MKLESFFGKLKRFKGDRTTSFCSKRKLVQATRFLESKPILSASPSKTYFSTDSAVPAHKNVLSLASSRMLNNSSDVTGSLEGLAWITSCKLILFSIISSRLILLFDVGSRILCRKWK